MLQAWYRDRPEVKKWQENTKGFAMKNGFVRTLMGRYRNLPDATGPPGAAQGHALRAAINTPIQGSAADVVIMAMIKLCKSEVLKDLGWKLLLQVGLCHRFFEHFTEIGGDYVRFMMKLSLRARKSQ